MSCWLGFELRQPGQGRQPGEFDGSIEKKPEECLWFLPEKRVVPEEPGLQRHNRGRHALNDLTFLSELTLPRSIFTPGFTSKMMLHLYGFHSRVL